MAANSVGVMAVPNEEAQEYQFTLRADDVEAADQQRRQHSNNHVLSPRQTNDSTPIANGYGTVQSQSESQSATKPPSISPSAATRALAPDLLRGWLMVLQAIDHAAVVMNAWGHGQAIVGESSGRVLTRWNITTGYVARLFTHLCAPGFLFLLGMGVVYFGRSRSKLGWSWWRMSRHFWIRAVILILVNQVLGILFIGFKFWLINVILLALAFDYLIVGHLWLVMRWTEHQLTNLITKVLPRSSRTSEETSHLLQTDLDTSVAQSDVRDKAAKISFHIHNVFIFVFSIISMWWNIWLDPNHGQCATTSTPTTPPRPTGNFLFEFFFHMVQTSKVVSGFPPMAWLFPALTGILYARIILSPSARGIKPRTINLTSLLVGLTLFTLFILTRLFRFGNLDEFCFHMPEHELHPDRNQYLASVKSFFYLTKYPPAPSFLFYTLSINFTFLSIFGFLSVIDTTRISNKITRQHHVLLTSMNFPPPITNFFTSTSTSKSENNITTIFPFTVLLAFGQSALFFYFVHMFVYMGLGTLAKHLFGHELDFDDPQTPGHKAWGVGNGIVFWSTWLLGLGVMWPACRVFSRFKARKGVDSVWRFF